MLSSFLSVNELQQQEEIALRAAEKHLESINTRVKGEIQALYDRMSTLFTNCHWRNDDFLILDEYIIEAPLYNVVKVVPGMETSSTASGLDRISKMVSFIFESFHAFPSNV
jgi:hypothetical protein